MVQMKRLCNCRVDEEDKPEWDRLSADLGEGADAGDEEEDEQMDYLDADEADSENEVDNRSMIERLLSPKKPNRTSSPVKHLVTKEPEPEPEPKSLWASSTQLRTFRADATKIAMDYLQEQDVKVIKARKPTEVKDAAAYKQGVVDGKTIDVRGKKIEG